MLRLMVRILGMHGKAHNKKEQQDLIQMTVEGV